MFQQQFNPQREVRQRSVERGVKTGSQETAKEKAARGALLSCRRIVVKLWPRLPPERSVMESYSSLFLRNRLNRYNLNLALGRVHVRLHPVRQRVREPPDRP